jgi:hypothetical protein
VHPYRVPPEPPPPKPPQRMPSEERFLVVLLIIVGGMRVLAALLTGTPIDGEATIGFIGLALGLWGAVRMLR